MRNMKLYFLFSVFLPSSFVFAQKDGIPPAYLYGKQLPDSVLQFAMLSIDGDSITIQEMLTAHEGKNIVIDFWASWCKDCIVGLPKFKSLIKRGRKKASFIYISVDKEEVRWKNAINRFSIKGEHYRLKEGWKTPLTNYIGLDWIPRYIVFNEKHEVIVPKVVDGDDLRLTKAIGAL